MAHTDRQRGLKSTITKALDSLLGRERIPGSDELTIEIVRQLNQRIKEEEWKAFPYGKINIRLQPSTKRMARRFQSELVENDSLTARLAAALKQDENVLWPENFILSLVLDESSVGTESTGKPRSFFQMDFLEPAHRPEQSVPKQRIEVLKGRAEKQIYHFSRDRMLIGCLPEVHDKEGRLVRKNNVVFPHDGDEINGTVSTMHARIWFEPEMGEFRIMDESSRYGTRLVRTGHTIEVPAENLRGVGLRSGDEICFGQACVLFLLVDDSE